MNPGTGYLGHDHAQTSHGREAAVQVALHPRHQTGHQLCMGQQAAAGGALRGGDGT